MNALLHDPIFRVKLASHTSATSLSLAEVCEAVWTQPIVSFEGLRTHQRQAWASFLSQLMVMVDPDSLPAAAGLVSESVIG